MGVAVAKTRTINMTGDICPRCEGTGERDFLSGARCYECNGTGWREDPEPEDEDDYDPDEFYDDNAYVQ